MKNFLKINKKEAADFYNKALFKTFFHSPEWQEFLEKEFKWLKFEHYLYRDELLFIFARVGAKLISLPFCEYGGPLPLKSNANLEEFSKDALEEFKNIKIKFHPKIRIGGQDSGIRTHWIENPNVLDVEKLFVSFRKTLRHSIRDAEKQHLDVKICSEKSELKQFYNLYTANLKRKKTVPYPFSVIDFLYRNPASELILALHKGKVISGCLFLHYQKFIHYFLSANDFKYRNLGANYLILWEKIKKSLPTGRQALGDYEIFDLGAAPRNSALEIFKLGWRGKEYPILQLGIQRKDESLRSSKLRNIWSLLPNFVIKKLSPYLIKYRI